MAMFGAVGVEQFLQGNGERALWACSAPLTAKEFSATQFALLSSLMALPRVIVGPFAGVLAYSLGWTAFFVLTVPIAIPGLLMLHRFVPLGAREAQIEDSAEGEANPLTLGAIAIRGVIAFVVSLAVAIAWTGVLGGMADSRKAILAAKHFSDVSLLVAMKITNHMDALLHPRSATQWVDVTGPIVFAVLIAAATAALVAARRGIARRR